MKAMRFAGRAVALARFRSGKGVAFADWASHNMAVAGTRTDRLEALGGHRQEHRRWADWTL